MGPQQTPVPARGPGPAAAGAVPNGQSTAWVSVGSPGAGWGQQLPTWGPADAGAGRNVVAECYWGPVRLAAGRY